VTRDLGLGAAGVDRRRSGHVVTNPFQQTTNPDIYAAGDVAGPHEIVHVAILQGEVAAKHAFGKPTNPVNYDTLLKVIFTDPQVAHVGLTEHQMHQRGIEFAVADYPFDDHGKSILMEAKYGYVKTWMDKQTGRIIAAECVGKDASELIHAMSVAVHLQAKVDDLLKAHWYHPTLSEIWTYPLEACGKGR
jgi:pyruvate/2-oxoglutarate dehydrogenase complex dihydrolipoamide dehydrogenase (E3) component